MANELTHALFSAAVMALLNPILGLEVIDWNVFIAGIAGMLFNLDRVDLSIGRRSPVGHSIGFAVLWIYVAGVISYLICIFSGLGVWTCALIVLALTVGAITHLLLDSVTGRQIYTIPNNLKPGSWLVKVDDGSDRFWGAWGRTSVRVKVRDSQVNISSLATILILIAVL